MKGYTLSLLALATAFTTVLAGSGHYEQCGGANWSGPTSCNDGWVCLCQQKCMSSHSYHEPCVVSLHLHESFLMDIYFLWLAADLIRLLPVPPTRIRPPFWLGCRLPWYLNPSTTIPASDTLQPTALIRWIQQWRHSRSGFRLLRCLLR